MPPCRYSITALWRCLAIALKPMRSNSSPIAWGSGAAYSMNSKPSVPMGLSHGDAGRSRGGGHSKRLIGLSPCLKNEVQTVSVAKPHVFCEIGLCDFAIKRMKVRKCVNMEALDKLDRQILRSLQSDGRATYDQIAATVVGLSPSAVLAPGQAA
jgi:hypothetical protein